MRRVIDIEATGLTPGGWVIAPRPFDHWGQRFKHFEARDVTDIAEIRAENSECQGYLMRARGDTAHLRYEVELGDPSDAALSAPSWVWRLQENRYTTAEESLAALAEELCAGAQSERAALRRIVDHASGVFDYGGAEQRFNDGFDAVPTVCGTTKGSCVDINTYILAVARSRGVKGQYVSGYWIHPHKTETRDMHCWLAFEPDGALVFWDLAHCLKWADTLGASVREGLNPAGGRRIAMSCGRGLEFATPVGRVSISHFSEPVQLAEGAAQIRPELRVAVTEPEGCRTQYQSAAEAAE